MVRSILLCLLVTIIIQVGSSTTARAGKVVGAYVGCITDAALDEFIQAASRKDYRQGEALINKTCFRIEGLECSIVKMGFVRSTIRVYVGKESFVRIALEEAGKYC